MSFALAVYLGVPAVTILINGLVAYWIYTRHQEVRGSRWFVLELSFTICWMLFEIVHLLVADPSWKFLAAAVKTKFAIWAFLTSIVFFSVYARADFHRNPVVKAAFGVVIAVTLLPTWMEPVQSLIYADMGVASGPVAYTMIKPGLGYRLIGILVAIMTAYALYVIVRYLLSTPRRSGLQLIMLVVGALAVMLAIALGNAGVFPLQDKTHAEFGALPHAVLVALALFRFRLFEVKPVARNAVVENLRDPVLVLDGATCLADYNAAAEAVWTDLDDEVGAPLAEACPELGAEITITDGDVEAASKLSLLLDGQRRHYSVNVSTIGDEGDPDLYAILLRDVTDLEQSRWQLETQNERLEQVAATISHDLRNPINVADGYAEMVEDLLADGELDQETVASARDHLGRIRGSHDRMEAIIDDVLTLAREGQSVDETQALTLSSVAHEAWEHVDTAEATLTIVDDRPLAADRSKLLSLLENLYRNVVEHAGSTATVTVGPTDDGFYVADDGPGIPAESADRVFEYGYSTDEEGTGLGLSIVRTIAESHGWTVELDAEYADGTRLVFRNVDVEPTAEREESYGNPSTVVGTPTTE